ncbi:MAG: hypothetical protein WAW96_20595 [Alphaproteobacteria bacterium]
MSDEPESFQLSSELPPDARGRPPRAARSNRALAGVDVDKVDPRSILREIAADRSAPARERVQACKALLDLDGAKSDENSGCGVDPLTERALKLLQGGRA